MAEKDRKEFEFDRDITTLLSMADLYYKQSILKGNAAVKASDKASELYLKAADLQAEKKAYKKGKRVPFGVRYRNFIRKITKQEK